MPEWREGNRKRGTTRGATRKAMTGLLMAADLAPGLA
jgi:hypothetical protein